VTDVNVHVLVSSEYDVLSERLHSSAHRC